MLISENMLNFGEKMNKGNKDRSNFTILGLEFNTKQTLITIAIAAAVLILLIGLDLVGVEVSWYGVLIGCAFLVALAIAIRLCKFRDLDREYPYDLIWWIFPFSIVGARLYYVIFEKVPFFWDAFRVWDGGMAIYGGIIGGAIGLIICCLIKKVNILKTMDIAAPVLILGQGIGRIGCYMAGCCVGNEVTNEALQFFPVSYFVDGGWHLATFFYECVLDIAGFFILLYMIRKIKDAGVVTFSYLLYYGIIRAVLETFREVSADNALMIPGTDIKVSQLLSIICVVIGTIGLCYILIKKARSKADSNENKVEDSK